MAVMQTVALLSSLQDSAHAAALPRCVAASSGCCLCDIVSGTVQQVLQVAVWALAPPCQALQRVHPGQLRLATGPMIMHALAIHPDLHLTWSVHMRASLRARVDKSLYMSTASSGVRVRAHAQTTVLDGSVVEQVVAMTVTDNLDLGCVVIERAATDKVCARVLIWCEKAHLRAQKRAARCKGRGRSVGCKGKDGGEGVAVHEHRACGLHGWPFSTPLSELKRVLWTCV